MCRSPEGRPTRRRRYPEEEGSAAKISEPSCGQTPAPTLLGAPRCDGGRRPVEPPRHPPKDPRGEGDHDPEPDQDRDPHDPEPDARRGEVLEDADEAGRRLIDLGRRVEALLLG